ncbi:MAG: alpha/beta hydrolase-fold protein [Planctomycetota bacterium]
MKIASPLLALVVSTLLLPAQERRPRPQPRGELKLANLRYESREFESAALGKKQANYSIFVPKDYDDEKNKDQRYPLVLWLHGMFEDKDRFATRGGAEILDRAVGDGLLPPCLFVCPEGRSSFWTNAMAKDQAWEDMVTKDLLHELEANWRVAPEREKRAIMGVSMGGFGAMKIAFKHPDLFGIVAVHSAAILTEDPEKLQEQFPWLRQRGASLLAAIFGEPVDVEKYHAENVLTLAKTVDVEKLAGLKIWFEAGTADRYKFHLTNGLLHDALEERKIRHTWRLVDGGGHSWGEGATQEGLPQSLGFVAAQFSVGRASAGLGALFGGEAGVDKGKDEGAKEAPTKGDGEEKKR